MKLLNKILILSGLLIFFVGCEGNKKKEVQRDIIPSNFAIDLAGTVVRARYRKEICARYKQHPEMGAKLVSELLNGEEDIKYIYSVEYDRHFSVDELKQLDSFFSSELGEKYLDTMITINNRVYDKEKEISLKAKR